MLALVALALGACAQSRGEVAVSVGADFPATAKARDYAALYVPYAMMATAAYAEQRPTATATNARMPDCCGAPARA